MPESGTRFDELMQQAQYEEALELAEQRVRDAKGRVRDTQRPKDREAHIDALVDQVVVLDIRGRSEDADATMQRAKDIGTPSPAQGWQGYCSRAYRWLGWLLRLLVPKAATYYKDDLEYKRAQGFNKYFTPREEMKYDWLYDYARSEYERLAQTSEYLDAKAGTLIHYVSAFSGAAAVAFAYQALATDWSLGLCVLPSFFLAILAVRHGAIARRPISQPFPPALRVAIQCTHSHKKPTAKFATEFELATQGLIVITSQKAGHVAWATGLFLASFILLLLPLGGAVVLAFIDP
ncbi:MAG: hypothetical protein KAW89_06745 [Armatimonadetes bacterium]|nr:hypothetical protein [Armatimonadota bacterium]